jgi:hypothetical protein
LVNPSARTCFGKSHSQLREKWALPLVSLVAVANKYAHVFDFALSQVSRWNGEKRLAGLFVTWDVDLAKDMVHAAIFVYCHCPRPYMRTKAIFHMPLETNHGLNKLYNHENLKHSKNDFCQGAYFSQQGASTVPINFRNIDPVTPIPKLPYQRT